MDTFPLLPLGAMAARLGVQPRDLREAAENGSVPCVRLGQRGLMFDPQRVESHLVERASDLEPDPCAEPGKGCEHAGGRIGG